MLGACSYLRAYGYAVDDVRKFEDGLYKYADLNNEVLKLITERKELDEEIETKIKKLVADYKATL